MKPLLCQQEAELATAALAEVEKMTEKKRTKQSLLALAEEVSAMTRKKKRRRRRRKKKTREKVNKIEI